MTVKKTTKSDEDANLKPAAKEKEAKKTTVKKTATKKVAADKPVAAKKTTAKKTTAKTAASKPSVKKVSSEDKDDTAKKTAKKTSAKTTKTAAKPAGKTAKTTKKATASKTSAAKEPAENIEKDNLATELKPVAQKPQAAPQETKTAEPAKEVKPQPKPEVKPEPVKKEPPQPSAAELREREIARQKAEEYLKKQQQYTAGFAKTEPAKSPQEFYQEQLRRQQQQNQPQQSQQQQQKPVSGNQNQQGQQQQKNVNISPQTQTPKPASHTAPQQPQQQRPQQQQQKQQPSKQQEPAKSNAKIIKTSGSLTVRELAEKMEMRINDFISKLIKMGVFATINQTIDNDTAVLISAEFGYELQIEKEEEQNLQIEEAADDPASMVHRPPVITIMGHVDHGKTKLLDAIRSSNVCEGEAGAITQHIGAYCVNTSKGKITILDTPGHEAFTAMRSRGAQVTDIVILVVSAVDGIMPQTIEALNHAKAAGAPIIVAVNKIDVASANPEKIRQDLAQHGLMPEEWQGDTIYVDISAKQNLNIDKLLEMVLLQAEMMDLKANPNRRGTGSILESKRDPKRGVVVTVLNSRGTMRVGDPFVVGANYGRIRALIDENGNRLKEITPSMPAEILGINGEPPEVGEVIYIAETEKEAKEVAEKRRLVKREEDFAHRKHVSLLNLKNEVANNNLKKLQVVLKGDVQGSIQAIRDSLERLGNEEVEIKIIHAGPGNVNESDILLAKASDAIILAFHVAVENKAKAEADREGIEIRSYSIIFELIEDVKAALEGMLEPDIVEEVVGKAEVRQKFNLSSGIVAGSYITEGSIERGTEAKIIRNGKELMRSKIAGLKRFKDDVKEVSFGFECGIIINGYKDIEPGDIIEAIKKREITRRLVSR